MNDKSLFGKGDYSWESAGGFDGILLLCQSFYKFMDNLDEAKEIRKMHPDDLSISIDKLARFLSGWLGGPRLYAEKYGPINIPMAHKHLLVSPGLRDQWLLCMKYALKELAYEQDFQEYMLEQLYVPAERIRMLSRQTHQLDE